MSAEEKILQGILQDAKLQADKIIANGKTEETAILEEGKTQAKAYSAQTVSAALIKAKAIKTNAESAANLTVRDIMLAKKHSEIEKTLGLAIDKIVSLPDEKYFSLLCGLAAKNARSQQGVVFLSPADLGRKVSIFEKMLKNAGVNAKISSTPSNIKNGFILSYGDVEYNLSLEAVISDKRDILEDKINSALFAE